jgi:3-hydroxyisobutyrate dehydrogenase-like beta-hydroxyacid dehydrogenase
MANLGFVGLGVMGGNMVARLLEKGHTVTGHNRTRAKAQWLIDQGMRWADSPRSVAAVADTTFSMVTNTAALQEIAEGPDGMLAALGQGKTLIEMSTVSPEFSRALSEKVRATGADMVDSPVSGSVITLQQGKLSVMVGGKPETFEKVKPRSDRGKERDCTRGGRGRADAQRHRFAHDSVPWALRAAAAGSGLV